MLDLGDVLQLVDNRLDNGTLASEQLVGETHQSRLHVALRFSKQLDAAGGEQLLKEGLRNIAPVSKDFAKQGFALCDNMNETPDRSQITV